MLQGLQARTADALQEMQARTAEALQGLENHLQSIPRGVESLLALQGKAFDVLESMESMQHLNIQQLQVMKMMELRLQWLESSMQDGLLFMLVACQLKYLGVFVCSLHVSACVFGFFGSVIA